MDGDYRIHAVLIYNQEFLTVLNFTAPLKILEGLLWFKKNRSKEKKMSIFKALGHGIS